MRLLACPARTQFVLAPPENEAGRHTLVIDLTPFGQNIVACSFLTGQTLFDLLAEQPFPDADRIEGLLHDACCVCLVNHVVVAPSGTISDNAEVMHFYLLRNAGVLEVALGSAGDPLPASDADSSAPNLAHPSTAPVSFGPSGHHAPAPLPVVASGPSSVASDLLPSCTPLSSACSAFQRRPDVVGLSDGEGRYTVIGCVEGAINRPREISWDAAMCLSHAVANAPRRGPHLRGRVLSFPLPDLFLPQVLLSRADAAVGWLTIAVDLRPLRLGVRGVDVRVASTVGQLFATGSWLLDALDELGRLDVPFRFRINSGFASRASAFSAATETLTVEQDLRPAEPGTAYGFPILAAFGQPVAAPPWSAIARDVDDAASPDAGSGPSRNVVPAGRPTDWPSLLAPPGSLPIDLASVAVGDVSGPEDEVGSATSVSQEAAPIVAPAPLLVGNSGPLPIVGNATVSTTSTTTFLAQPPACMHGTTSTTSTGPGALPLAVTVAFSVPGDQPRCVRLGPGEHVADVLWQILQDPWRILPEGRAWTLAACPRSFPDRLAGRLVLTTVASINANQCCVWVDVRSEPPGSSLSCWTLTPHGTRFFGALEGVHRGFYCYLMELSRGVPQRCGMAVFSLSANVRTSASLSRFLGSFLTIPR